MGSLNARNDCAIVLFLAFLTGAPAVGVAQTMPLKPDSGGAAKPALVTLEPQTGGLPQSSAACNFVHEQAPALLRGLADSIPAGAREAAGREAAKATGAPTAQSWHDVGVVLYLQGNMPLATWAALAAAVDSLQETFIADAGTILLGLGRDEEGVQFLHCAYETGDRSPYQLEALAAGYVKLGKRSEAREIIDEIDNDAIADPIIDIEQSFLDTGKPPPTVPPPTDELQRCLAMLDQHMARVVAEVRTREHRLDALLNMPNQHDPKIALYAQNRAKYAATLRSLNAAAGTSPERFNVALISCMSGYSMFTQLHIDNVLSTTPGMAVFFWANVLTMTPEGYVDDTNVGFNNPGRKYTGGFNSVVGAKTHSDNLAAAGTEETNDIKACDRIAMEQHKDNAPCDKAAEIKYCHAWQALHDQFAEAEESRYNTAAHRFDPAAEEFVWAIEAELADARGFLAGELKKLKPASQPFMHAATKGLTDSFNIMQTTEREHLDRLLHGEANWFLDSQNTLRRDLEQEQKSINVKCEPILATPKLDTLAEDDWNRLMAHFSSDFDSTLNCDGQLGETKVEWKEGGGFSLASTSASQKWENIKTKLDATGKVTVSSTWDWNSDIDKSMVPVGPYGAQVGPAQGSLGPVIVLDPEKGVSAGVTGNVSQTAGVGPISATITVKGSVTLMSDTNPMTGKTEPTLSFKASSGLSVLGITCFPGEAKAKVYPRGLVPDAINYVVAAGTSSR